MQTKQSLRSILEGERGWWEGSRSEAVFQNHLAGSKEPVERFKQGNILIKEFFFWKISWFLGGRIRGRPWMPLQGSRREWWCPAWGWWSQWRDGFQRGLGYKIDRSRNKRREIDTQNLLLGQLFRWFPFMGNKCLSWRNPCKWSFHIHPSPSLPPQTPPILRRNLFSQSSPRDRVKMQIRFLTLKFKTFPLLSIALTCKFSTNVPKPSMT